GHAIEKRRLSRIGVADECDNRMRHLAPLLAMQRAGAHDRFKLTLDLQYLVLQQASVGFDLRFTGATEESATTALALKVGPASDQTAFLIIQMRQFDLQGTFLGVRTLAENFENEPRTVDDLDVPFLFQIALLHRRQRMIDDDQPNGLFVDSFGNGLHFSRAEQGRRSRIGNNDDFGMLDVEIDRPGKPYGFLKACLIRTLKLRARALVSGRTGIVSLRQDGNDDGSPGGFRF